MERIWKKETRRFFKEERRLTFDDVLKEDVPSIFTKKQHELLALYRDGVEGIRAAEILNINPQTEKSLKSEVVGRMQKAFGDSPGKEKFQRAVGVSILAGWIEPRVPTSDNKLMDLENELVRLMLYGFNLSECAKVLYMSPSALGKRMRGIRERLNVQTDCELVAHNASELRQRLIQARSLG